MPNLRIVADNAADRASSVSASSTAGTLVAANLLTNLKSQVWRAGGTAATLTVMLPSPQLVSCVVLPFCNLTPSATIHVYGSGVDTGSVLACPAPAVAVRGFGSLGAISYGYGGGSYARVWFPPTYVTSLNIDIFDSGNPAGYIEAARLVVGAHWSPTHNADSGAAATWQDASKHYRTDAGDLMTDIGARNNSLSFNMLCMPASDRSALASILRANGMASPIFVSLFPENADVAMERDHQIFGKLTQMSAINLAMLNAYSSQLSIEEI